MGSQSRYALLFKGLKDDGSETLRRVKTVFVADLELPIPQIQEILSNPPATILEEDSKQKLSITLRKLKAAGALVEIVKPEEEAEDDDEDEFAFELDLSELAGASKPAKTRVWELNMQDSDETEALIANLEIPSMVNPGSEPQHGESEDEEEELEEELADTLDTASSPSNQDIQLDQDTSTAADSEIREDLSFAQAAVSEFSTPEEVNTSASEEQEDLTLGEPTLTEEPEDLACSNSTPPTEELSISSSDSCVETSGEPVLSDEENLDLILDSLEEEEPEQSSTETISLQAQLPSEDLQEEEDEVSEEENLDLMLDALEDEVEEEAESDNFSSSLQELTGETTSAVELNSTDTAESAVERLDFAEEPDHEISTPPVENALSEDLGLSFDEDTTDVSQEAVENSAQTPDHEDLGISLDVDSEPQSETTDSEVPPTPEQEHVSTDSGLSLDENTLIAEALAAVDTAKQEEKENDSASSISPQPLEDSLADNITIDLSANTELEPETEKLSPPALEEVTPTAPKAKSPQRKKAAANVKGIEESEDDNVLSLDSSEAPQAVRVQGKSSVKNGRGSQKRALAIKEIALPIVLALVAFAGINYGLLTFVISTEEVNPLGKFDDSKIAKPQYEIPVKTEPEEIPEFQIIDEQVTKQLILKSDEGLSISARCDLSDKGLVACELQGTGPESRQLSKLELAKKVKRPPWIKKFDTPRLLFKLVTADQSRIAEGPVRVVINYDNRIYRAAGNIRLSTNKMPEQYEESPEEMLKEAKELKELDIDPEDIEVTPNELKFEIFLGSEPRTEEGFSVSVEENLKFIFTAKYHFEY